MTVARFRKSAVTLVELLVVRAMIDILRGMLLPAVQAAREATRRMQCSNNWKQLGVAAQNYESSHKTFPLGFHFDAHFNAHFNAHFDAHFDGNPTDQGGGTGWAWGAFILPFIEAGNQPALQMRTGTIARRRLDPTKMCHCLPRAV